MFDTLSVILKTQACHCVNNWKSYLKLYLGMPIFIYALWIVLGVFVTLSYMFGFIYFFPLMQMIVLIFFLYSIKILCILGARFVCLDEKPSGYFSLKYSKQAFLYSSYSLLICLFYLAVYFTLFLFASLFINMNEVNPTALNEANQQITSGIMTSLQNAGLQAIPKSFSYAAYINLILMYLISYPIVFSLFVFNTIAIACDISIPFYRSIGKLKKFFFVNYLLYIIFCLIEFSVYKLWYLAISHIDHTGLTILITIPYVIFVFYICIFWFLCTARSFKLWHQSIN